jgi:hypothetical protein
MSRMLAQTMAGTRAPAQGAELHACRRSAVIFALSLLSGCGSAPSRNILGSYFPSWMVCALAGIAAGVIARAVFKATGVIEEIPAMFAVILAIVVTVTLALWLVWLA